MKDWMREGRNDEHTILSVLNKFLSLNLAGLFSLWFPELLLAHQGEQMETKQAHVWRDCVVFELIWEIRDSKSSTIK